MEIKSVKRDEMREKNGNRNFIRNSADLALKGICKLINFKLIKQVVKVNWQVIGLFQWLAAIVRVTQLELVIWTK